MGLYFQGINQIPKEEVLEKYGKLIHEGVTSPKLKKEDIERDDNQFVVCLIDNTLFTAAGIMYDYREYEGFSLSSDHRYKKWYIVPKNILKQGCDDGEWKAYIGE